jgi:hypothetical protein
VYNQINNKYMATKATLINSSGKKVVVDSGSAQAQSYFSQGYQLMGASGQYMAAATKPAATPAPTVASAVATPTATPAPAAPIVAPAATPAAAPAAAKTTPANPAANQNQNTTLYYKDGTQNIVPSGDVSYWVGQGWSTAKPGAAPAAATDKNKYGQTMEEANDPANWKNGVYSPANKSAVDTASIATSISSGAAFDEATAKLYASSKGESNWQQYVGGIGGKANANYIGSTNWANLQKQYTPYQLEKATVRTKDGIYWNPDVNIGQIPRVDPVTQINADTKKLAEVVSGAKETADPFATTEKKTPELSTDADTNESQLLSMLQDQYGDSAEKLYEELFNTPEMKSAQQDVVDLKSEIDGYDQQIDELKDDIRTEVEGEAPESYITALATVRGEKILKLKRSAQREYDTALANYNGIKENATNLLSVKSKDADTRYNRMFQMLQLQIQQEGTAFNKEVAIANIAMSLPENRSITIGDTTVKGLKENDDLNVVQFTEANGKTYVIGVNKKTGVQVYKQYIGTAKVGGSGSVSPVTELNNYNATQELARIKDYNTKLSSGAIDIAYDEKGNSFYYDKPAYDAANKEATSGFLWGALEKNPDKIDYRL